MQNLPLNTDNLDAIPEESRKLYHKTDDGKYAVNPTELLAALTAKDKALASERKIRSDFETKYTKSAKELESIDKDKYGKLLEKEKEWETEKEQRERETLEAKGRYEEALEKAKGNFSKELSDLKADFEKKLKKSTEAVERSESDKKNYILDDKIRRAVMKAGVFADDVDDVLTLTRGRFALDDNFNVVVKDDSGNASDLNVDAFFGENFKKQKPKFYQGTNASGSGSPAGKGNRSTANNSGELTSIQKIQLGLQKK